VSPRDVNEQVSPQRSAEQYAGAAREHVSLGDDEFSLVGLATILLRDRYLILLLAVVLSSFLVGIALLTPRTYSASASFIAQSSQGLDSRLSVFAAQLGVTVPSTNGGRSPAFYVELLRSRGLLTKAVETTYVFVEDGQPFEGNLVELFEIEEDTYQESREMATEELRKLTSVRIVRGTGIVELVVTAQWAVVAEQVAHRMLELVNEFNVGSLQAQAGAERTFIEGRLEQTSEELRRAEDRLQSFLVANRDFRNSPELIFEHDRLQREVRLRQDVLTSLNQAYEQARIQEVRNTPIVSVIEEPTVPVTPDSKRLVLRIVLGLGMGMALGVVITFGRALALKGQEQGSSVYEEFVVVRQEAAQDLQRRWHRLYDLVRGRRSET